MRKIFTLLMLGATMLVSKKSSAQLNENFDNGLASLSSDCWQFIRTSFASGNSQFLMNGAGSIYSQTVTNPDSITIVRTPLLILSSSIDVAFMYRLEGSLNSNSTRDILVDLTDANGNVIQHLATLDLTDANQTATLFSQTFAVTQPGLYRLQITLMGDNGSGSARISVDDLSESALVYGCPQMTPLPVMLMNFQGNKNLDKVNLQWTVATNDINSKFEIERSTDGATFTPVGLVMADEKVGTESYQFTENETSSSTVYYRLKMYDQAQSATYSKVLIFKTTATRKSPIHILNNPAIDKLNFSYYSDINQVVDLKVYDMNGRMQMSQKLNVYQGSNVLNFPLSNRFLSGIYVLEVNDGSAIQTAKFVKQ